MHPHFKQTLFSLAAGLVFAGLFSATFYAMAIPPTSTYSPGETLNPSCAPGDANCTVTAPVPYTGANQTINLGSQTLITTGAGTFSFAPTQAHTFSVWATGTANSNASNASLYNNPSSATAGSNIFAVAVNGSVKALIDAGGDIYGHNLILEGSSPQGATTVASLTVEGTLAIGDAAGDAVTVNASNWTLTNDTAVTLSGGVNGINFDSNTLSIDAANDRVGILTASPSAALSVGATNQFQVNSSGAIAASTGITTSGGYTQSGTSANTFTGTVTIPTPFTLGAISVTSTGTQLNYLNAATGTTGTTSTNLVFSTSPTITTPTIATSATVPLVIGGTGTTSDLSLQTTSGVGATGADMHFLVGNNGATEAMTILNSGDIGVGNPNPVSLLSLRKDVVNALGPTLTLDNGSGGAGAGGSIDFASTAVGGTAAQNVVARVLSVDNGNKSAHLTFSTKVQGSVAGALTERMRITDDGNVLIGTSSDLKISSHLAVKSASGSSYLAIFANNDFVTNTSGSGLNIRTGATTGETYTVLEAFGLGNGSNQNIILNPTSGNVGIGTTAPQSLLDVQGPVGTGATGAGILTLATKELTIVDGDELGRINFNAPLESDGSDAILAGAAIWGEADDTFSTTVNSTELVFGTATTSAAVERMRIDSAGNVGIGTATPVVKLDVRGNIALGLNNGGASTFHYIGLPDSSGSFADVSGAGSIYFKTESDNASNSIGFVTHSLGVSNTTRMLIDKDGNVGIGTATPSNKLHVMGSAVSGSAVDTNAYLRVENNGQTDINIVSNPANKGILSFLDNSGAYDGGEIDYDHSNDAMSFLTSGSEKVRITTAGLVGIGTTAPQSLLDVQGPVGTGATGAGILTLATKELTIVDGDELGRINFNAPLESDGSDAILAGAAIWGEADDTFSTTVNSTELVFGTATTSAAVERMRIDSAGNVGIGDISPDDLLNISSAAAASGLAITSLGTDTDPYIKFELADGTASFTMGVDDSDGDAFKISTTALGTSDFLTINAGGSVILGSAALATDATDGFLHIPSSAGTPTGTPTAATGRVPIEYDTTNNRIYAYRGGAWHYFAETAGFQIPNFETTDPISGEKINEGDIVLGMIDKTLSDDALHGVWVTWNSVKKQLLAEARGELSKTQLSPGGFMGSGAVEGVDSDTFLDKVKNILVTLGISVKDGVVSIATLVTQNLSAKTARVEGLEMVDKATGAVYCTWIENGELQRVKGECSSAEVATAAQISNSQLPIANSQFPISNENPNGQNSNGQNTPAEVAPPAGGATSEVPAVIPPSVPEPPTEPSAPAEPAAPTISQESVDQLQDIVDSTKQLVDSASEVALNAAEQAQQSANEAQQAKNSAQQSANNAANNAANNIEQQITQEITEQVTEQVQSQIETQVKQEVAEQLEALPPAPAPEPPAPEAPPAPAEEPAIFDISSNPIQQQNGIGNLIKNSVHSVLQSMGSFTGWIFNKITPVTVKKSGASLLEGALSLNAKAAQASGKVSAAAQASSNNLLQAMQSFGMFVLESIWQTPKAAANVTAGLARPITNYLFTK